MADKVVIIVSLNCRRKEEGEFVRDIQYSSDEERERNALKVGKDI